jgi:fructose-1,6-bisphosphatase/inositol monophosphatase family enzyme
MSTDDGDFSFLLETVRDAARTEILPRFRALGGSLGIAEKTSSIDLVTQADLLAEAYITDLLRRRFPDALVVGEEAYDADKSVVPALASADLAFVIDPVDGTFNFASGSPVFGTILAVVVKGETVGGIIHDAVLGDTITGRKGGGASLVKADGKSEKLRVAEPKELSSMVGSIPFTEMQNPNRTRIASNLAKIKMVVSNNCSAYDYWLAASGTLDFIGHPAMMPWDHLAGLLIHSEAGGYSAKLDGSAYRPGDGTGNVICAADKASWNLVREEIVGAWVSD